MTEVEIRKRLLLTTIALSVRCPQCGIELLGGPGSGCHGPNCGRPSLGKSDLIHGRYKPGTVGGDMLKFLMDGKPKTVEEIAEAVHKSKSIQNIASNSGWFGHLRKFGKESGEFDLVRTKDGKIQYIARDKTTDKPPAEPVDRPAEPISPTTPREPITTESSRQGVMNVMKKAGYNDLQSRTKETVNTALDRFSEKKMDPRLVGGLEQVQGKDNLDSASTHGRTNGLYYPGRQEIKIRNDVQSGTFIHEVGHHVENRVFNKKGFSKNNIHPTPEGTQAWIDAKIEFYEAASHARRITGLRSIDFYGAGGRKTWNTLGESAFRLKSVSAYALANEAEWFAESFREYYQFPDQLLRKAPKTYDLMSGLNSGQYIKEEVPPKR